MITDLVSETRQIYLLISGGAESKLLVVLVGSELAEGKPLVHCLGVLGLLQRTPVFLPSLRVPRITLSPFSEA